MVSAVQSFISAYGGGTPLPSAPGDPVVLTSTLTTQLAKKLDTNGDGSKVKATPRYGTVYASVIRPLEDHIGDMVNLRDLCPANLLDPDQPGWEKALNNAAGKPIVITPGTQIRPTKTVVPPNGPLAIVGYGNGYGPGAAAQDEAQTSLLRPIFSDGPVLDIQGHYPCLFKNFRTDLHPNFRNGTVGGPGNTGPAFLLRGPTNSVNSSTVFDDVAIVGKESCITFIGPFVPTLRGCKFMAWSGRALSFSTYPGVEGNGGEVVGCTWFGQGNNPPGSGPCIYTEIGYIKIHHNFIGGGNYALEAAIKNGNAGDLHFDSNTCEDQYAGTARLATQDGSTLVIFFENNTASILNADYTTTVQWHVVAEDNGTDWLVSSTFKNNKFRSALKTAARYFWIQTGSDIDIEDNRLVNIGPGSPRGIDIFGPVSSARLKAIVSVKNNKFRGAFTSKYSLAPNAVLLEHLEPDMTVAQLSDGALGTVLNGSRIFASDGSLASFAPNGPGAFYRRQNNMWGI